MHFWKPFSFVCVAALSLWGAQKKTRRLRTAPARNRGLGNFRWMCPTPRRVGRCVAEVVAVQPARYPAYYGIHLPTVRI